MSNAQWLVKDHVIHYYFSGEGSIEQLQTFNHDISTLLEDGEAPIYIILDIQNSDKPLLNISAIAENLAVLRHEKIQWVVTYGLHTNTVFRFLGNVLSNILGVKSRMFSTKAEAYEFVADIDLHITYEDLLMGEENLVRE